MKEIQPEIKWLRGGVVQEVTWIGSDVIAWCTGPYIVFYDVIDRKLSLPNFPTETFKGGAACLSGHRTAGVFAFSEKNSQPEIFVHAYPSLERLSTCGKQKSCAYLATAFANDFLVSIGSLPDFQLCVWSWRTGEKLVSVDSAILDAENFGQSLRISHLQRAYIAQVGNTSGRLCIWEMSSSGDTVILSKNEVELPNRTTVRDVAWRPDSTVDVLAIADRDGHIYLSNALGTEVHRIVTSHRRNVSDDIEPSALCWYRGGLLHRATYSQLQFFQKDAGNVNDWKELWHKELETYPCVLTSYPLRNDRIYYFTLQGHIVQVVFNDKFGCTLEDRYFKGGRFKFLSFVHPWDGHLVAIDQSRTMVVISVQEGARIVGVDLKLNGNVECMMSHPDYPLITASTDIGEITFVSVLEYHKPKILGKYRMQHEPLNVMRFSKAGRYLAAIDKEHGICYFFNVHYRESIRVVAQLEVHHKIADVISFEVGNILKIFVLFMSSNVAPIGHRLYMYDYNKLTDELKKHSTVFDFNQCYSHLHHAPGNANIFFGSPYLSKQIHFFKFINDWKDVVCYEVAPNGHNLRQIKMASNKNWIISSSVNGNISVRSLNVKTGRHPIQLMLATQHQKDSGVLKTTMDVFGYLAVLLGVDGMIVSIPCPEFEKRIRGNNLPKRRVSKQRESPGHFVGIGGKSYLSDRDRVLASENAALRDLERYTSDLDKQLIGFLMEPVRPFSDDPKLTWNEWEHKQIVEKERKRFAKQRSEIAQDFKSLQRQVVAMIDRNSATSDLKRLPIATFAMATAFRERLTKNAKDEREEVRHRLEQDIHQRDRISSWLQANLWDSQVVHFQSVFGIFDDTEVTNYTTNRDVFLDDDCVDYAAFSRRITSDLFYNETVYPWDDRPPDELNVLFDQQVRMRNKVESSTEDIDTLEGKVPDPEEELCQKLFDGLTAYKFVEQSDYYSQFRYYAFDQIKIDSDNAFSDGEKLRNYFNKKFDEVFYLKEREMSTVLERIDRLNFIITELKTMFNETIAQEFEYPQWHRKETPEDVVQVSSGEISASMYLTPSEEDLLARRAAEEERLRLAKLADDFRERALTAMMDGVLEKRWDDVIKKDVDKPECMVSKTPDQYSDEDKAAIKRYEQDVKTLKEHRETYRKTLHGEFVKLSLSLKDSVEMFNARLCEFHVLRLKVESAIQQLDLRRCRYSLRHMARVKDLKEVDRLKVKLKENYQLVSRLAENLKLLKNVDLEMHERYDNLIVKDKYMERKLRNDFATLSKTAYNAIYKQYKRRPRTVLKTASPHEVIDLAKSVTSMDYPVYLTKESLEFLKQLANLDVRPAGLPDNVDHANWEDLLVSRRLKIAQELRLHASMLEMIQVEQNRDILTDKLTKERGSIESMKHYLIEARRIRLVREVDNEIQLVLKSSQVEINGLRGDVASDTSGAILVPLASVSEVNDAILTNGRRKVLDLERFLHFKKYILVKRWEYECLHTRLKHAETEMYFTEMAQVTRSVREFLSRRAKNIKEDNSEKRMEREFNRKRKGLEKLLQDWRMKVEHTRKEIDRVKQRNAKMDARILKMNVDRCEMEHQRDYKGEERQREYHERVTKLIAEKSRLFRKLLESYEELVALRAEYRKVECNRVVGLEAVVDEEQPSACHCPGL